MMKRPADRILEMLDTPRPASELAEGLGLSRQAIQNHLRQLMREQRVQRLTRTPGKVGVLFVRQSVPEISEPIPLIHEHHQSAADKVLGRLRLGHLYSLASIANAARLGAAPAYKATARLVEEGYLSWFFVAGLRLSRMTAAGVRAQRCIVLGAPAQTASIADVLGPYRENVVRALAALGEADLKAIRAFASEGPEVCSDVQTSKAIASLRSSEVLATAPHTHPGRHRLTELGRVLAQSLPAASAPDRP